MRAASWMLVLAACSTATPTAQRSALVCDELPGSLDAGTPAVAMSPLRRLRRMTLVTTHQLPTREKLQALSALHTESEQEAFLDAELDRLVADPAFYDAMVEFGHVWINIPPLANIADAPEYGLAQQRTIIPCPDGTLHAGKLSSPNLYDQSSPCNGVNYDGTPAVVRDVEPWWAEGTTVQVVGVDGDPRVTVGTTDCGRTGSGFAYDRVGACGCGPNLIFCRPGGALQDYQQFLLGNPTGHRRLTWDEPARLFAHLVWHDRSLEELIAGDVSVGPADLQGAYVRQARKLGAVGLDADASWWRASQWTAPTDPHHATTDARGWSEFRISDRNTFLLAARDTRFDPRREARGTLPGIPSAGLFTMPGVMAGTVRERVRSARLLEMFACETFVPPPPTAHFSPYVNDPAGGGPCVTCHSRIDPGAIHFKRFIRTDRFELLGVGDAHVPRWNSGQYPYDGDPWDRMRRLWLPETKMTPVTLAEATAEPEALFIDFLPPEQTLYGATSDGTIGPLGFAKLLLRSGVYDRCVVRRLHERFVGRDVDPTGEAGYLEALTERFVAGDRKVKPFLKYLASTPVFRSGL